MKEQTGVVALMADVKTRAAQGSATGSTTRAFILDIADAYAFIRLEDWRHPRRFLQQMAGAPPITFGTQGFRRALVDDQNPARHYTAFVFVGYWLPIPFAVLVLWAWEILGFFRYRGHWSQPDIRNGYIGIRHGRQVRQHGPTILADLIEQELAG
ncbi:MAG: hypothetical protein R3E79_18360 [Caldilineaceae bacterium]